ncbi:uncharacterized protein [Apostichopus japonicus]|uniref:uncharacterized protein n=1 Tax=Stichopus japonicus TaxID=307972 RepID=UPI003AB68F6A
MFVFNTHTQNQRGKQINHANVMALRIFALNVLYFALTNATKGISTHTVLINSDIEIEWYVRKHQVRSMVLEKDGAQLLNLDPRKQSDVTKGQFYAELTENVRVMLRISNVTPENGGIYSNITYYDTGNADKGTFLLQVQGPPGLINVTTDVTEGEAITAQCCVQSSMEPWLTWMVDTGIVRNNMHSLEIATVFGYMYCGQIQLTSQRIHNSNEIICEVQNGLNLSASSHLNVFYQPTINIFVKGTDTCTTRSCIFEEFANVTLLCSTDGNPKPNVTLKRIVKTGEFYKLKTYFTENGKGSTMNRSFPFSNFTRRLYGRYRCEASNGIGDIVFAAVLLNVTFAATVNIVVSPTPDTVTPHGNFAVECQAYSNPFPTISLQKKIHGEWVTLRISLFPQTKRRLRYQAVWTLSYDDDYMGLYRCMADNGIGRPAQSNTTVLSSVQDTVQTIPKRDLENIWVIVAGVIGSIASCLLVCACFTVRKFKFNRKGRRRKELPKIPVDEYNSQNSHHSEGSEPNYYSTADAIAGNNTRMLSEKDISIIMNIKMGNIYQRWIGSVNLFKETNKCVVITTMIEKLIRKKNIHWEAFIRKCLELPASNHLAKIEAISIQSSKLFLISEHLNCENLHSVLSRDTKDKGDYYCCSSLSVHDVIKHVAGVLEGMDILKTFGVPTVTLNQFPPEMLMLNHYTETSDVWSTAVVIWEIMAAGSPPFPVDKEVRLDDEAITPSVPWPEKYWQIKDKILFDCWKHNSSLRPSIHHLRGTFVAIFEKLITDSSYEIPIPTTYLPMRALDTAQLTYAEQIYHAGM